ncbi:3-hydroxyacyl-CoA dehydrogenase/enoyl-CoA hydratase family protein [Haliangium ochraceum]|uniref:3-hydroxyacyl-CoA dehydrogenase NAD-binding protein n=1 Tax=Haliangium ochraceum (strain DSM 14365 / JCM 11303 / SMP-2) TaxID=502025 RepID=D0LT26_HALO1|nr:3-hydroxyacyl-CoA dehydrogenase/enoyl-CoA hydratase family protein [Haliangium ochraceum]ACY19162.1 3-hydroxyacyl-CoA dehydrogenase NAD-binding protein [Haliangium ochraceum DSM 14365]
MSKTSQEPIRRIAVLGAGVMGSGIAAHVANASLPVLLLDIVPPKLSDDERKSKSARDAIAAGALKAMGKARPAPFFHPDNARLVSIGNFEDDLDKLAECDLVIEAIIERLDIKRGLFEKLDKIVSGDTIIASNTSGLRISEMLEGRSERFRKNFLVMHFFNPPRYMKLLELVAGPDTDPAAMKRVSDFGREVLGKGIVVAKDAPNFVANRIGTHAMMGSLHLMQEMGLSPEDLDQITGVPMGHPKSATLRTADMVGLDTLVHVVENCHASLTEDEDREVFTVPEFVRGMVERKQLGNKTKGGFYRKTKAGIETFDPSTGEYRPRAGDEAIKKTCKNIAKDADPRSRVRKLVAAEGKVGEFAWKALSRSLAYTARRVGEIADDIDAIDNGMKWGYNWELGPFETWDALGFAETVDRMKAEGIELPESVLKMRESGASGFYDGDRVYDLQRGEYVQRTPDPREVKLEIMRRGEAPVLKTRGGEAWDLGDGVLGVTFGTKANSIDADVIQLLHESVSKAESEFRGVLIANQGDHFCVGANLFMVVMAAQQKKWDDIKQMTQRLQEAGQRMKYATVPVVAAPFGMALGGGLEVCLASDAVQAAAETYAGLVEVGVGLIPAGGGCMNLVWRALESIPDGVEYDASAFVVQVFKNIALAEVATSAGAAKRKGYFRHSDGISFDRARQLHEAKQRVIGMADAGYHAPLKRSYKLPGESGIATLELMVSTLVAGGYASEHDAKIASKLAAILCGGVSGASRYVSEEDVLELEREAFVSLCGEPKSQERMQHMLMHNKPLRN